MSTRHNLNPNPKASNNVTGWAQSSAATPARVTGLSGPPVTTGAKWTTGTYQTTAFGTASPGVTYTVSAYVLAATFNQNSRTAYLNWSRSSGGDTQLNDTSVSLVADTWQRITVTGTAPANTTGVGLLIDGINASVSNVTITAVLAEAAAGPAGDYFDGDSAGGSWDGTAGNSASTLTDAPSAPVVTVWDGAAEVDATVTVWDGAAEQDASVTEIAT